MTGRMAGKVAFITGAARGQGRSHAITLAGEGADIIAIDACTRVGDTVYPAAGQADLDVTVKEVEALGRRVIAAQADVRDLQGLKDVVDRGVAELGRLDVVVANAGIGMVRTWDDFTPHMWQDTIDVNVTGTWNTIQASAQHLIDSGGGSVIIISSVSGVKALPYMIPYATSKAAVNGMAKAFALEFAKYNIRVNSVVPTGVDTPMNETDDEHTVTGMLSRDPKLAKAFSNLLDVRYLEPDDVSRSVLYLASDDSRYVTAHVMAVDAGATQF